MTRYQGMAALALAWGLGGASAVEAQSLGTFRWQLQPYCNIVNVTVTQNGGLYTLDGYDDQCGAPTRASVVGTAIPNPNGSITLGFTIVTTPDGTPVHVQTPLNLATLGGPWSDSAGHAGTLVFTPGAGTGGSPRPAPITTLPTGSITSSTILDGTIGVADIDSTEVQRRVAATCPAGELMTGVNQDGTVACQAAAGGAGDITAVIAGTGLAGGSLSGNATLNVIFSGSGAAGSAARSDHTHTTGTLTQANTAVGEGALASNTGVLNVAVGPYALRANTTGGGNTGLGYSAMNENTTGGNNTAIGVNALLLNATTSANTALGRNALLR
jgi:hypothetical protein